MIFLGGSSKSDVNYESMEMLWRYMDYNQIVTFFHKIHVHNVLSYLTSVGNIHVYSLYLHMQIIQRQLCVQNDIISIIMYFHRFFPSLKVFCTKTKSLGCIIF